MGNEYADTWQSTDGGASWTHQGNMTECSDAGSLISQLVAVGGDTAPGSFVKFGYLWENTVWMTSDAGKTWYREPNIPGQPEYGPKQAVASDGGITVVGLFNSQQFRCLARNRVSVIFTKHFFCVVFLCFLYCVYIMCVCNNEKSKNLVSSTRHTVDSRACWRAQIRGGFWHRAC